MGVLRSPPIDIKLNPRAYASEQESEANKDHQALHDKKTFSSTSECSTAKNFTHLSRLDSRLGFPFLIMLLLSGFVLDRLDFRKMSVREEQADFNERF